MSSGYRTDAVRLQPYPDLTPAVASKVQKQKAKARGEKQGDGDPAQRIDGYFNSPIVVHDNWIRSFHDTFVVLGAPTSSPLVRMRSIASRSDLAGMCQLSA